MHITKYDLTTASVSLRQEASSNYSTMLRRARYCYGKLFVHPWHWGIVFTQVGILQKIHGRSA